MNSTGRKGLVGEVQFLQAGLDQTLLVVTIHDGKTALVSDSIGKAAQNPKHHGMKCSNPHGLAAETDQRLNPLLHFIGGLVGKCNGQNGRRPNLVLGHQPGDPMGDHPRFAGTGTGQDQQRTIDMAYSIGLLGIKFS